jgi:hypothetical protein
VALVGCWLFALRRRGEGSGGRLQPSFGQKSLPTAPLAACDGLWGIFKLGARGVIGVFTGQSGVGLNGGPVLFPFCAFCVKSRFDQSVEHKLSAIDSPFVLAVKTTSLWPVEFRAATAKRNLAPRFPLRKFATGHAVNNCHAGFLSANRAAILAAFCHVTLALVP